MDRTMRCATVTASSTTDPQQIKVMELEHYDEQKDKKKLCACSHNALTIIGVVNRLNC